ncbi:hypothetical protein [Actinospica robiniae]|uniref:hypothetical protein n=1 Tax=Actinospica robiniae TaxID=304901 RepID=UPI000411FC97|nr:hypothetical protein [Actinospica robiniae]
MPDLDESKNQAMDSDQQDQGQAGQSPSSKDKMMDQAKKRMDTDQDGKVDSDEAKKSAGDAVNKVKGLFKKS